MRDDDDMPDCDHEDYELDILIGRATCSMCGHRWYLSADEFRRYQERQAQPYPGEESA